MATMLEVGGLSVGYARKGLALDNVSLTVPKSSIVALLGANGAGKTTLIRAISGLLSLHHGEVKGGGIEFEGQSILGVPSHRLVRMGMAQVPEGRLVFKQLAVEENLAVGAAILPRSAVKERMDAVYALFPRLLERRKQAAGMLSGGEQQMLALGRAWITRPRLLAIDELTLGLAPVVVEELKDVVRSLRDDGVSMIIVEQSVHVALELTERACFLERGRVRFDGSTADLAGRNDLLRSIFFAGAMAGGDE